MKLAHYRNQAIQERLQTSANQWLSRDPSRSFEKPERNWFYPALKILGIHLLLLLPALFLFIGRGDFPAVPALISLLFPFLATTTLSNIFMISLKARREEITYLLPLDNLQIARQTHADHLAPFLKGLFYSTLYGMISGISASWIGGALMGSFIFIGLGGILTLSFLPRMSWLYSALFYGPFVILFGAVISDILSELAQSKLYLLPWYHALYHPPVLIGLLVTGITCGWLTRSLWWSLSPFDRTLFYEVLGSPHHEHEIDEQFLPTKNSLPKSPQGLLEKFIWKSLNIKERGLARAVGWTCENLLRNWVLASLFTLTLVWLSGFTWIFPLEELKTLILVIAVIWASSKFWETGGTTLKYLEGISLGSQAIGSQFQLLPLSLSALERLHWKEVIPKAILTSITVTFGLFIWLGSLNDLRFLFFIFVNVFSTVIILFWFPFWNRSINHWPPKRGSGFFRHKLLQLLLIVGVFIVIIAVIPPLFDPAAATLYPAIISGIYLLLIRIPLRSIIKDNRCDLMAQG